MIYAVVCVVAVRDPLNFSDCELEVIFANIFEGRLTKTHFFNHVVGRTREQYIGRNEYRNFICKLSTIYLVAFPG